MTILGEILVGFKNEFVDLVNKHDEFEVLIHNDIWVRMKYLNREFGVVLSYALDTFRLYIHVESPPEVSNPTVILSLSDPNFNAEYIFSKMVEEVNRKMEVAG